MQMSSNLPLDNCINKQCHNLNKFVLFFAQSSRSMEWSLNSNRYWSPDLSLSIISWELLHCRTHPIIFWVCSLKTCTSATLRKVLLHLMSWPFHLVLFHYDGTYKSNLWHPKQYSTLLSTNLVAFWATQTTFLQYFLSSVWILLTEIAS